MHFNVVLTQALRVSGDDDLAVGAAAIEKIAEFFYDEMELLRVSGDDDLAVGAAAIEKIAEFFYDEMELPKTLTIEKILTDCL